MPGRRRSARARAAASRGPRLHVVEERSARGLSGSDRVPLKKSGKKSIGRWLESFSQRVAQWTGTTLAFVLALSSIVVWSITGPIFHYSDTWQLVINTATTIVTFLMVVLIQRAQNKDTRAIELKLNELIAALEGASNRLIDVEDLPEEDLEKLHKDFRKFLLEAQRESGDRSSHSVEEVEARRGRREGRPAHARPQREHPTPERS